MPKYAQPVSQEGIELNEAGGIENISIKIATRATSAAPTYFPVVKIFAAKTGVTEFWDGGLLNNNPIDQVWRARLDLVGATEPPPKVACILSLGTSWSAVDAPSVLSKYDYIINFFTKPYKVPIVNISVSLPALITNGVTSLVD